ncbi:phage tail protein [Flavobacterium cerinum]|uniref:Tail fiber protein n=1 Tax=Flavobacterium cerinum TaxID=2502784 RepID=A0ABY5IQM2_9FLAO|nr:hypothetical protein [Flavobacterium cerinum]UUC45150.1 hypothetical protein NOX80_16185 [Flavobacterium cerinum]
MMISDFTQIPMGTILPCAFDDDSIPVGWLKCDGSKIPDKYITLKKLLKMDCTPNLAGRTLIGSGTANNNSQSDGTYPNFENKTSWPLGQTGGEYKHKLTVDEMPKHKHTINGGDFGLHVRSFKGSDDSDIPFKTHADDNRKLYGVDAEGGDKFHNTMQPYYVINYIIYAGSE